MHRFLADLSNDSRFVNTGGSSWTLAGGSTDPTSVDLDELAAVAWQLELRDGLDGTG